MDSNYLNPYQTEPVMEVGETGQPVPPVQSRVPTPAFVTSQPASKRGMTNGAVEVLKVSGKSRPASVAGAIAGVVKQTGRVELQAIGAGATNQAVKAIAVARSYLISGGIDIFCLPTFFDITLDGEERTAIKFTVEKQLNDRKQDFARQIPAQGKFREEENAR